MIGIGHSKYHDWRKRYGKANEHNALIARDHWLEPEEKQAIIDFYGQNPLEGYRRLTFMMLDQDVAAASPSTVYRVLKSSGLLERSTATPSKRGTGFHQPAQPHEHWHVDIAYINAGGTFYYLCCALDGASRYIVDWDIRESMTELDVEIILQAAREKFPQATPRIISDNGPQFIARDFKEFIRVAGMTHVRISPGYPQSNGKIERWNKSLKTEAIRPGSPLCLEDARRLVATYVEHYNTVRLHSAIGYVTPLDALQGRQEQIWAERDRKLEQARERRRIQRAALPALDSNEPVVSQSTRSVKRKRALQECNPPGIAASGDEHKPERSVTAPHDGTHPNHFCSEPADA